MYATHMRNRIRRFEALLGIGRHFSSGPCNKTNPLSDISGKLTLPESISKEIGDIVYMLVYNPVTKAVEYIINPDYKSKRK